MYSRPEAAWPLSPFPAWRITATRTSHWRNLGMTTQSLAYTPGPQGEFAHRPIVWGTRGMVGGGTQLTAQVGMRMVWHGGNAVGAAGAGAVAAGVLGWRAPWASPATVFPPTNCCTGPSVARSGWRICTSTRTQLGFICPTAGHRHSVASSS